VMDICCQQAPPLYQTDARRVVSCYLYADAPVAANEHVTIA